MAIKVISLGAGGHAKVIIEILRMDSRYELVGLLDSKPGLVGKKVLGVPILGDDNLLPELVQQGVNSFVIGLGSTGNNQPRQRLFEFALSHNLEPLTVVHPRAICSVWAKVGHGSQLLPGSIVNGGAVLGENVLINSGAIVEHDCVIANHVHIATGAKLASTVHVGRLAHIGAGATVRQCITIGEGVVVGAGAVVVKDVAPHTVVVGVPARILRKTCSAY
ncbi:MAG: acetyltransferase [Ardenticatenaceae bacterium]